MNIQIPEGLSTEAVIEFQKIYEEEFGEVLNDTEAEQMGMDLLRFFAPLVEQKDADMHLTEQESIAFRHIHDCICHNKRQPTVRSIAEAIGKRSPRSGFRVLKMLMKHQFVWRNERGEICIVEGHCEFWRCGE